MAVVVTVVAPVTPDMYDAVSAKTMPAGQLPEGCSFTSQAPSSKDGGSSPSGTRPSVPPIPRRHAPTIREQSGSSEDRPPQIDINPVHRLIICRATR